jgi:hypothetical protein
MQRCLKLKEYETLCDTDEARKVVEQFNRVARDDSG